MEQSGNQFVFFEMFSPLLCESPLELHSLISKFMIPELLYESLEKVYGIHCPLTHKHTRTAIYLCTINILVHRRCQRQTMSFRIWVGQLVPQPFGCANIEHAKCIILLYGMRLVVQTRIRTAAREYMDMRGNAYRTYWRRSILVDQLRGSSLT